MYTITTFGRPRETSRDVFYMFSAANSSVYSADLTVPNFPAFTSRPTSFLGCVREILPFFPGIHVSAQYILTSSALNRSRFILFNSNPFPSWLAIS